MCVSRLPSSGCVFHNSDPLLRVIFVCFFPLKLSPVFQIFSGLASRTATIEDGGNQPTAAGLSQEARSGGGVQGEAQGGGGAS